MMPRQKEVVGVSQLKKKQKDSPQRHKEEKYKGGEIEFH